MHGASGVFTTITARSDTTCTGALFGDPADGTSKAC
jgi:hypothetical protein